LVANSTVMVFWAPASAWLCLMLVSVKVFCVTGFRVQGSGSRVQGPGLRVQGSGSRVQGPGLRVEGSGLKAQSPGFRVQG